MSIQEPSRKPDSRVAHTKHQLQKALIQLLQSKDVKRVTVRELCEVAQVNRSTFYAYYQDIYDLLEQVEQQAFDAVKLLILKEKHSSDTITNLMRYIQKHADLFQVLFHHMHSKSYESFMQVLRAYFLGIWQNMATEHPKALQYRYVWICAGFIGTIQEWLQEDCQDSPEFVAGILWDMVRLSEPNAIRIGPLRKETPF